MELVRNFKKLNKSNADLAGGKGASLGEMTNAGIPVPPGFVVLSASFEQFIRETDLYQEIDSILHSVNHKEIHTVDAASEKIRALILNAKMPKDIADEINRSFKELNTKYVAVRSSATAEDGMDHAWAGQLESYLNTKEDQILDKVKLCWSSLFTPRAIFYRFEKALHMTKISVAVVVQKMVESEVSGIAFSVHPVTEDWNQLIIEAGFGLGEAIVSGSVTPDSYVVEKEPRRILDINVSTQDRALYRSEKASIEHGNNEWLDIPEPKASSQVLTGAQIMELSEIILHIEKHYGFPCDIEWAFEKGKFYIVQSRPITTLAQKTDDSKKKSEPSLTHTGYNFTSPELKKFNISDHEFTGLWKNDLFATCFWQDSFVHELIKELGLQIDSLRLANLAGGHFFVGRLDKKHVDVQVGARIDEMDQAFFENMIKVSDRVFAEGVKSGKSLRDKEPTLENFNTFTNTAKRVNLLWLLGAAYFIETAEKKLQEIVVKESFPAEHVMDIIPKVVTPIYHYNKDLAQLSKDIDGKSLSEVKKDKKLSKMLQNHVDKYPWIEILNFVGEPLTPERLFEQIEHIKDLPEAARYVPKKPLSKEFLFRAKAMQYCGYVKQAGAEYFSIFSERVLPFLDNVAKEIGVTYAEFICLGTWEIEDALKGKISSSELKKRVRARKGINDWILFSTESGGIGFCEEKTDIAVLKDLMIPKADKATKEIKGQVGNPGKYTGPARVIMNTHDFHKMKSGDVLVSTMTTPDFVILMQKSGAIVTDIGGMLCHAAIVSREIGTPCVIGTRFATQILKDGDMVEVDADNGVVRILNNGKPNSEPSFNKEDFFSLGQWVSPTLEYEAWLDWCNSKEAKSFGISPNNPAALSVNGHYHLKKRGAYDELKDIFSKEFKSGKFLKAKEIIRLAEKLSKACLSEASKLPKEPNFSDLKKAFKTMSSLRFPWMALFPLSAAADDFLSQYAIKKGIDSDKIHSLVPELPNSVTIDQKKLSEFKESIQKAKLSFDISVIESKKPKLAKEIANYQKKTEYIGTHHLWGDERSMTRLMEAIKNSRSTSIREKSKVKSSAAIEIISLATKWRLECAQSSAVLAYSYRSFMTSIALKHSLTYQDIIFLTLQEIEEMVVSGKDFSSTIKDRQKGLGITKLDGKIIVVSGEELKRWETDLGLSDDHGDVKELRGSVGNKGIVRGIVVVVLQPSDQSKVKPGMILVAPETTPDYIPAMGKAAAFVTNQGGITSHAAIVAREMDKPCIIGTKIGTKVLKDGDMVEVDADNGIVRILK